MKIEDQRKGEEGIKMSQHIKFYDFSRPSTGIPNKKAFRAYSAIAKKKK